MKRIFVALVTATIFVGLVAVDDDEEDDCLIKDDDILGRAGLKPNGSLWKGGKVAYTFAENFTNETERTIAIEAMWHIENRTCIRFSQKTDNDIGFILMDVSEHAKHCGEAVPCFMEGPRPLLMKRARKCSESVRVWAHEIGHSLCLGHEFQRPDRDEFLYYQNCPNTSDIPKIRNLDSKGHFYDYFSIESYTCRTPCKGQIRQPNVKGCARDFNANPNGLTVLDADKLNHYYNCQGCYAHRWHRLYPGQLEPENVINFAAREGDTRPLTLCRAYDFGSVSVGRMLHDLEEYGTHCVIFSKFKNEVIQAHLRIDYIQVFGYEMESPIKVEAAGSNATTGYRLISNKDAAEGKGNPIGIGRDYENNVIYAAFGEILNNATSKMETVVGSVYNSSWTQAFVVSSDNQGYILDKFDVLACTE